MPKKSDKVLVAELLTRMGRDGQLDARRSEPPAHAASRLAALDAEGGTVLVPRSTPPKRPRRHGRFYPVLALGGVVAITGGLMLGVGFLGDISEPDSPETAPAPSDPQTDGVVLAELIPPAPQATQPVVPAAPGAPAPGGAPQPATLGEVLAGFAGSGGAGAPSAPAVTAAAAPPPAPAPQPAAQPAPQPRPESPLTQVLAPVTDVLNPVLLPLLK